MCNIPVLISSRNFFMGQFEFRISELNRHGEQGEVFHLLVVLVAPHPLQRARRHLLEVVLTVVPERHGPRRHPAALRVPRGLQVHHDGRELLPRQVGNAQVLQESAFSVLKAIHVPFITELYDHSHLVSASRFPSADRNEN